MRRLIECIRMINCMGYAEFNEVFQNDAAHLRRKLNFDFNEDVSKWLCYLDLNNIKRLERYFLQKESQNKAEQRLIATEEEGLDWFLSQKH